MLRNLCTRFLCKNKNEFFFGTTDKNLTEREVRFLVLDSASHRSTENLNVTCEIGNSSMNTGKFFNLPVPV
jgi:hypothetical protein